METTGFTSDITEGDRNHGKVAVTDATKCIILTLDGLGSPVVSNPSTSRPSVPFAFDANGVHTAIAKVCGTPTSFRASHPTYQIALLTTSSKGRPTPIRVTEEEILLKIGVIVVFYTSSKDAKTA